MRLTIHVLFPLVVILIFPQAGIGLSHIASGNNEACNEEEILNAVNLIKEQHYRQGRRRLKRLVASKCSLMPVARLLIADCYYREGGSYNLAKAEVEYMNWLQLFPDHNLTPFVMQKVVEIHLRQVLNNARHLWLANKILLKLQDSYPQFRDDPIVQEYHMVVEELLAEHDLKVAKFYLEVRESPEAAKARCMNIIEKWPGFSRLDVALWYLAQVEEAEANSNDFVEYYKRIVREYASSEYGNEAIAKLKHLGANVPEPDLEFNAKSRERLSKVSGILADIDAYARSITRRGIILDEKVEIEEYRYKLALQM